MRYTLNTAPLHALPDQQKRTRLFDMVKQAQMLPHMLMDMMGPARTAKAFAANDARMAGPSVVVPTQAEVAAYLTSAKAARFQPDGQKWAVPADNPLLTQQSGVVVSFFHDGMRDVDLGWQTLFDLVDLRNSNQDHFELLNSNFGVAWEQKKPGGQTKPRREISEAKTNVPYLTYTAGYSLLDDWIRYNKFYLVSDMLNEVDGKYWELLAQTHYGLFNALGAGVNVARDTDDQTTFNKAAAAIIRANEGKGYGISANAQLDIVTSPEKVGKIIAMLDATRGSAMIAYGNAKQPISFQVRNIIVTNYVPASLNGYYLVLPGRKLKRGAWLDKTVESKREPSVSAEDWFAKAQFNAILGDADQVRRVLFE